MQFKIDENVLLRLLDSDDADALFGLVDSNRKHLRVWLPWLDRNTSPEHSLDFVQSIQAQNRAGLGFACGVFFREELVGICGFHEIDRSKQEVVIGYWLAESQQGNGIITKCARFCVDYAFKELKLDRVLIPVASGNTRSRRVCERLGLRNAGIARNAENLYGTMVDHIVYETDAQSWSQLKAHNHR